MIAKVVKRRRLRGVLLLVAAIVAAPALYYAAAGWPAQAARRLLKVAMPSSGNPSAHSLRGEDARYAAIGAGDGEIARRASGCGRGGHANLVCWSFKVPSPWTRTNWFAFTAGSPGK